MDLTGTANVNNGNGYNYALNKFYQLDSTQVINQYYVDSLHSYSISPTLAYTEPISKKSIIQLNYSYSYNKSNTVNDTYDFMDSVHKFAFFDSLFSNSYRFVSYSHRFTLSYRVQDSKYNLNIGSGVQLTDFNSFNTTKGIDVQHSYVNLTPTVNFMYSFSNNQRLRFYYTGRTGSPTASQLQPLTTTSDDINFTIGNPNLKPQFTHSIRILYQSYDPSTQHVLFATLNASTIVNDIQSSIVPTVKGGDSSTYVNLNGTYSLSGYFNYSIALKHPKSNLNFITNVNYGQSQNLVYSVRAPIGFQHDYTRSTSFTEKLNWTTNIKKNFDMNFSSASTYTLNRNTLNTSSDLDAFSQVFNAEITAYTNSGWLLAMTVTYTFTDNRTPGYNESVPLLTPSVAKELFKKKNGELRLTVFDLLHQNTNVSKSVSINQVSASRRETLSQYAMLTFTYNLNNFPGSNQRHMPGVFPGKFRDGGGGGGGRGGIEKF